MQACLSPGEPTRLDPEVVAPPLRRSAAAEVEWIVRYKNRAGRSFTTRITSEHIRERLQEGTLPASALARLPTDEEFQPLSAYAEFRNLLPAEEEAPPKRVVVETPKEEGRKTFLTLLGAAVAVAGGLMILLNWLWPR